MKTVTHPTKRSKPQYAEYQTYGVDSAGHVVHAGVDRAPRICSRSARKIQRKWLKWRHQYLLDHPGWYPLRDDAQNPIRRVVHLCMYPVSSPEKAQWFKV